MPVAKNQMLFVLNLGFYRLSGTYTSTTGTGNHLFRSGAKLAISIFLLGG